MTFPTSTAPLSRCCICGGGPAGMMLGLLLARAGVPVTVLEKHGDFLRDFRGDTVHPSTLQILDELGLRERFDQLPQRRVDQLSGVVGGRVQPLGDFRGLRPYGYLALVPQWDLLNLLADAGRAHAGFDLRMRHAVTGLIHDGGRVAGVEVATPTWWWPATGAIPRCARPPASRPASSARPWMCCGFRCRARPMTRRMPSESSNAAA